MPNPPTTPSTPKSPSDPAPAPPRPESDTTGNPPPPTTTSELTALLLDVLRNVNREVNVTLALSDKAQAAVAHFQAISGDLRTLADGPTSFSTSGTQKAAAAAARRR